MCAKVKLCDLGMATKDKHARGRSGSVAARMTEMLFPPDAGTPHYMPPEALDGKTPAAKLDGKSWDVFAVGQLLYFLW